MCSTLRGILTHPAGPEKIDCVTQALKRSDFIKTLVHLESCEIPLAKQVLIDVNQIVILAWRNRLKNASVKCCEAVVDVAHARGAVSLVIVQDSLAVGLHVAGIELARIVVNGHQAASTTVAERRLHGSIIANQVRIAVKHKELLWQ